jgi:hypothetical protein
MRSDTVRRGEIAKCEVLRRAYEKGVVVSLPTVDTDYDAILEIDGKLYRGQIKYANSKASNSAGAILLYLRRTTRNKRRLVYTRDKVDVMLVYLPAIDKVLWLPPKVWDGKTTLSIRTAPSKNGQQYPGLQAADHVW